VITDIYNKPVGIFTQHDVLKVTSKLIDPNSLLEDVMTKKPFYVYHTMDIHDAYMLMEKKGFRHIIVVNDNEEFLGVVSEGDFLRQMGFEENSQLKDVSNAMSDVILSIDEEMTLSQVSLLLSKNNTTFAVVIKDKKAAGIIDEYDITTNYKKANKIKELASIYSRDILFIKNDTPLQKATKTMSLHGVHQLLVVDEKNNLLGSITRHDILKSMNGTYFEYLIKKIEDKTDQERKLKHLLNYDQLTHLPNRNLFRELLQNSIDETIKSSDISAVVLLDLDRFKEINDSYGHSIGDELLQTITNRLKKITKQNDVIARLGGDEFAIILKNITNTENASFVTNKIINHISSRYRLSNGVDIHLSTTAGISMYPQDAKNVEELIQFADSALYRAKIEQKGSYRYYSYEMTNESKQKIEKENLLREALKNGYFELHYQPQIHIATNKITGCEALIRLKKSDGSYIPPNEFIPVAEESGIINQIGEWVIEEACNKGKKWLEAGHRVTVAVNVSANQMRYQDLSSIIDASLNKSGFEASKLEIEITESAVMQREEEAV
ncbi:MAG: diguanylate cyclase, partial [Campylobacterales bacterium]|nr:diguanylate cyclase [Campylobacterales bacterium]